MSEIIDNNQNHLSDLSKSKNLEINQKRAGEERDETGSQVIGIDKDDEDISKRTNCYQNIVDSKDKLREIFKEIIDRTHTVGTWDMYSENEETPHFFYSKVEVVDGQVKIKISYELNESRINGEKSYLSKIDESIKKIEEKKKNRGVFQGIFQTLFKNEEEELTKLRQLEESSKKETVKDENNLLKQKEEDQKLVDSAMKIIDSFGLSEEELKKCFENFDNLKRESGDEMYKGPDSMYKMLGVVADKKLTSKERSLYRERKHGLSFVKDRDEKLDN